MPLFEFDDRWPDGHCTLCINFLMLYLVEYQKKGLWEFGRMIRRTKLLASFSVLRILTRCSLSELPMLFVEAADQKELNLRHN